MKADLLIHSAVQLVTCASGGTPKRGAAMQEVGLIENGAVAVADGKIIEVGNSAELSAKYTAETTIDASGKVICPGFVDPHTHVVYAGNRINEFELRIKGTSYMDIMAAGGGIVSTMKATRAASVEQLIAETRPRMDAMLKLGTTTIEIKSGYGLDTASEMKMLEAIALLDSSHPCDLIPTFMGAHAVPPEYQNRPDDYVTLLIQEMIPQAAELKPVFVDVFCEKNAFTVEQSRRILAAGQHYGMKIKAHVDEFTSLGGVKMALDLGAVSVDHLDVTGEEDIHRLAESETIAVVIPAVNFNLGSTHFADARAIIDAGAVLALTTDINPGSAPCPSMPMVMAIACRYQHLLPAEALNASTINAAYALDMGDRVGSLETGKQADLLILNVPDYRYLAYQFGDNLVGQVIKRGKIL
ncbi:MAG: imidazolonepropionase [Anaerolineae bacterium]|nr:imidazolonepropionase [Anaerolineae bacterium]